MLRLLDLVPIATEDSEDPYLVMMTLAVTWVMGQLVLFVPVRMILQSPRKELLVAYSLLTQKGCLWTNNMGI